jgi:hypothetical protein
MVEFVANLMERSSHRDLVLASETEGQQKLLTAAGLAFRIVPPEVDEAAIHEALYNTATRRQFRVMSPSYSRGRRPRR